ncbi:sigma-70 family RNA polymerase sigma factor [Paraclostridium bifermentans]|uniref:sigma-70 family RNA polymerase sigma factor n=1 Tax=Paraclostridium bifermentans TaxID=1490 RepID=UPI00214A666F|nr:sigma-70 family RNA polymerase sigma factor [Paraclostridium bifermentans]MCR1877198.1 sigma-70 family RNA polymerase sigma factor [Paraclostridium bifermentans]
MIENTILKRVRLFSKKSKLTEAIDLVNESKKGSDQAFEDLINIYKEYLYKMAFIYTKNEHDALDIYQETVYKAYLNIGKLKDSSYFKTWITRILINNVNMKNRHVNRFKDVEVEDYIGEIEYSNIEEKIDLYDAIDVLEEKYKTPIILQYFQDLTISQISKIMDCNENTVKSYIRRGKKKLYDLLKEES